MNYRTSIPVRPAVALEPLLAPSPGVDMDVYSGLTSKARVDLDRQAQMANAEYMGQARDAQARLAMQGMGQMADRKRQAADLTNARLGYMNSILKGLFP